MTMNLAHRISGFRRSTVINIKTNRWKKSLK